MRKVFAIARLTILEAVRSRLLLFLAAMLLLVAIAFPLFIKGDGTSVNQVRVALTYTISALAVLMGIATLWISCGAISRDIEHRHLRLTAVKPVHRYDIWLGRWLGIMAINAVLLAMCGSATGVVIQWKTGQESVSGRERRVLSEQVLTGRRRILPDQPDIRQAALNRLARLRSDGRIPETIPDETALAAIRKYLVAERTVVPPDRKIEWRFRIDPSIPEDAEMSLRFRFKSPMRSTKPFRGTWTVHSRGVPDAFILPGETYFDGSHTIALPAEFIVGSRSERAPTRDPETGTEIQVSFMNDSRENSRTVIFPVDGAVEILIHESGFSMNLLRAGIVILCHLALLSALGLTAGALFSFPVASFVTGSVLVAVLVGHFFVFASAPEQAVRHHHHHDTVQPRTERLENVGTAMIELIEVISKPLFRVNTPVLLSDGILISWTSVGRSVLILVVLYSGALGILGSVALSKRELALPG